jgi:hypothetical protein
MSQLTHQVSVYLLKNLLFGREETLKQALCELFLFFNLSTRAVCIRLWLHFAALIDISLSCRSNRSSAIVHCLDRIAVWVTTEDL